MSQASDYAANASRILTGKAAAIAEGKRTSGQILGQTIATLGDVIPRQVQAVMQANAQKRKTEQIHGILAKHPDDLGAAANEIMGIDQDVGMKLLDQHMQAKKFAMEASKFDDEMKQRKQAMLLKPFLTATNEDEWDQARLNARVAGADKDIPYASLTWSPDLPKRVLLDQMPPGERYTHLYPDPKPKGGQWIDTEVGGVAGKIYKEDEPGAFVKAPPKDPTAGKKYEVTVPGPNGPVKKLFTEEEMIKGVREYRAPTGGGPDTQLEGLVQAVIQNPELWDRLTPTDAGKIAPRLNQLGFDGFGKPLSDKAVTTIAQSKGAITSLTDLREVLKNNEQYIGPIAGLSALNPYSEARKAQSDIDRVRQRVGKALEGGVLRKEDEEKYKKILSTLTDVPSTAIYKVDQMIQMLQNDITTFQNEQRLAGRRVNTDTPPPNAGANTALAELERRRKAAQKGAK